jgi:hypothetical protein
MGRCVGSGFRLRMSGGRTGERSRSLDPVARRVSAVILTGDSVPFAATILVLARQNRDPHQAGLTTFSIPA